MMLTGCRLQEHRYDTCSPDDRAAAAAERVHYAPGDENLFHGFRTHTQPAYRAGQGKGRQKYLRALAAMPEQFTSAQFAYALGSRTVSGTTYDVLRELAAEGYIETNAVGRQLHHYRLTERGRTAARMSGGSEGEIS